MYTVDNGLCLIVQTKSIIIFSAYKYLKWNDGVMFFIHRDFIILEILQLKQQQNGCLITLTRKIYMNHLWSVFYWVLQYVQLVPRYKCEASLANTVVVIQNTLPWCFLFYLSSHMPFYIHYLTLFFYEMVFTFYLCLISSPLPLPYSSFCISHNIFGITFRLITHYLVLLQ